MTREKLLRYSGSMWKGKPMPRSSTNYPQQGSSIRRHHQATTLVQANKLSISRLIYGRLQHKQQIHMFAFINQNVEWSPWCHPPPDCVSLNNWLAVMIQHTKSVTLNKIPPLSTTTTLTQLSNWCPLNVASTSDPLLCNPVRQNSFKSVFWNTIFNRYFVFCWQKS